MEVAGEELDNQQALRGAEAHILAPEIDDSVEPARAALNPIASREHAREHIMDKEKEKIDEKMKEPVFIRGIPLVDLNDYDVSDNKLLYDSSDPDDNDNPNADDIGVWDGLGSCLQTMDLNVESASRSVVPKGGKHFEPYTTPTASIQNPLFNAAGKTPHLDTMIIKQEAGWFQLQAEKRQRKTGEKLAAQQEKERLTKEVEDARNQVVLLK